MEFWSFVHNETPFHVYEFLALIAGFVMLILFLIHRIKVLSDEETQIENELPPEGEEAQIEEHYSDEETQEEKSAI